MVRGLNSSSENIRLDGQVCARYDARYWPKISSLDGTADFGQRSLTVIQSPRFWGRQVPERPKREYGDEKQGGSEHISEYNPSDFEIITH
jgi:hypothetical protein